MLKDLEKEMRAMNNSEKAKILAGFFKTGKGQYGEGDKFLGLTVPQTRLAIKKYKDISLAEMGELLQSEFHEERLAAVLLLVAQNEKADEKKKKEIFEFYLKNTDRINSWDLVDLSAPQIVGGYLNDKPKKVLFELARSKTLWERRIAMVATFFEIKNGKSETALAIAEELVDDKHDLMHKAVGWMLREVGKRCSRAEEEVFLKKHAATMPRTALRYALEHFNEKNRKYYMGLKNSLK